MSGIGTSVQLMRRRDCLRVVTSGFGARFLLCTVVCNGRSLEEKKISAPGEGREKEKD